MSVATEYLEVTRIPADQLVRLHAPLVRRIAYHLMLAGVIVFSGSLYALALTNFKWFGAITPLGGLGMLAGWLVLAFTKGSEENLNRR